MKHRVIDCSAVSPYRYGVGHDGYASAMTVRRRRAAAAEIACESERSRALTAESFGSMSADITKQTSQRARSGAKHGAASAYACKGCRTEASTVCMHGVDAAGVTVMSRIEGLSNLSQRARFRAEGLEITRSIRERHRQRCRPPGKQSS